MREKAIDVAIIGSGPAGMAAAISAKQAGAEDVLLIDREIEEGGILNQCIHNGFGTQIFRKDLTGPEYVHFFAEKVKSSNVKVWNDTMVLELTPEREIYAISPERGMVKIKARSVVLAMGCRERPRGAINIPGDRPSGVYTAGTVQRLINIEGYMPGERFVILGSGDIGMIMARRVTLEGGRVERVVEILPYLSGLRRNYSQCIVDYNIPLQLSHTVVRINGRKHLESVTIAKVDEKRKPIAGTEETIPADTLILSVGLIPENELSKQAGVLIDPLTGGPYVDESMQTNIPGIFAAGNVVHVYDLVDWVSKAGELAGRSAGKYAVKHKEESRRKIRLLPGKNVHHIVPQFFDPLSLEEGEQKIQFRVTKPFETTVKVSMIGNNNKKVKERILRYARPSEMIEINIPQSIIGSLSRVKTLSIDVEEVKNA